MKYTIIDESDDNSEILVRAEDGKIESIANTPYWRLKMEKFEGERMYWKFNDDVELQETYNNGIFNLFWGDDVINIGIEYQDDVATAIKTNNLKGMDKLYHAHKRNVYKKEMIKNVISSYGDRIEITDRGFIIDDLFMVDRHGTAYRRNKEGKKIDWKFVCIVAKSKKKSMRLPNGVDIIISDLDDTIIAKMLFLLHHDTCHKDNVFMDQLDPELREIIYRNIDKKCECKQCNMRNNYAKV